ncbi:hypothetical protein N8972_02410, partial [Sulfurospirillum sp.]|nr:hypothetical protein [Sulfurospirillum sp.]
QACDRKIALFQGKIIESGNINLLFSPWVKDGDENLVKTFSDGQELIMHDSKKKKRDAVVMIDSTHVKICLEQKGLLKGVISSIHKQNSEADLLVEISVAEVSLNATLCANQIKEHKILPGETVWLDIETKDVCWL